MTRVIILLVTVFWINGCASPIVKGIFFPNALPPGASSSSFVMAKGEALVVLGAASIGADDSWPAACVRDSVASADSNYRVMTGAEFRDAMFPWFETNSIETAIAELKTMPQLAPHIQRIGVRYVIAVGGSTMASEKKGLMLCGAGHGGGGCLGFLAWQRTSDLSAFVWDLKHGMQVAAIAAKITGANLLPAVGLPLPLIAPTETAACNELSTHLARFVTTGKVPESTEDASAEGEKQSPETSELRKN